MISPTRLSVRNIPFSYTEAQLKALCVKAVKERASKEKPDIVQVGHPHTHTHTPVCVCE